MQSASQFGDAVIGYGKGCLQITSTSITFTSRSHPSVHHGTVSPATHLTNNKRIENKDSFQSS